MADPTHPITDVSGKPAMLSHILELRIGGGDSQAGADDAFSSTTRHTLRQAAAFTATRTLDGRPVIDPGSYFRAVVAHAAGRLKTQGSDAPPDTAVLRAIVQSEPDRVGRLANTLEEHSNDEPLTGVVASPDLTEMLADAARLTSVVTPGEQCVEARHALVACLKTLPAQQAIWAEGLSTETSPGVVFDSIGSALGKAIENDARSGKRPGPLDNLNTWRSEIAAIRARPELRLSEPERRSDTHYVRDEPAKTLADDRLGLASEVRALAEVMCLRQPGPPLAIGLFGDWGSGKSTYMNLIEAAIEELTESTTSVEEARKLFVEGVVHIKFNAWHYNDADLWSSLTSEFFRQLRLGGYARRAEHDYSQIVQEVAERVTQTQMEADAERRDLERRRSTAKDLRREIGELDRTATGLNANTRLDAAKAAVETLVTTDEGTEQLSSLLKVLGHDVSAGDVATKAENALATYDSVSATWRGVLNAATGNGPRQIYAWLAGGIAAIAIAIVLQAVFPIIFGAGIAAVLGLASIVGAVGGSILKIHEIIEPVFRTASDEALRQEREAGELRQQKSLQLSNLEAEISEIEERRQALMAEAVRFSGTGPDQVLDFFLRESETTRSFEQSLGIISHVRRAFEQLDAIFKEANAQNKRRPEGAGFDRIVLYIDDLDRCRAQQVVEVLEAVHLLLAFPLFVVVVGVDARWLEQSLLEFYKDKIRDTNHVEPSGEEANKDGQSITTNGQATVHDFLEKIFQIPVRLRRLSAMPEDAFARYVQQAAGPVSFPEHHSAGNGPGGNGDGRTEIHSLDDVEIRPVEYAAGADLQQVRLTRAEVEMIEKLGPVAGKTPRAVKRFVNLYRLIRGIRRGPDLDIFLGETVQHDARPSVEPYVAYQLWLAVDVGLPLEQARRLRSIVGKMGPSEVAAISLLAPIDVSTEPDAVAELRSTPPPEMCPTQWNDLLEFWMLIRPRSRRNVYEALQFAMAKLPGEPGTEALKTALEDTRRFSSDRQ